MKKSLLFLTVLLAGAVLYGQQNFDKLRYMQQHNIPTNKNLVGGEYEFQKTFSPVVAEKSLGEDIVIGETRYDLQTNYSIQNRIYMFDDHMIGATWTMGFNESGGYPNRGTGYNYGDGIDWGPVPSQRIESVRTGWPSYAPYGENGEIVASHTADYRICFNWRENKGEGDWNEFFFEGPGGGPGLWWNRMITSGAERDTIHLLALTLPVANGGSLYEGQDGALLYSRSADGGQTWDPHNVILEGTGEDYYPGHAADIYAWAEPKDNTLAFVLFDGTTDGIVMKSDDAGDDWERIEFFDAPWDGGPLPDETGRFGSGDGSNAIVIDDNHDVHVVFGRLCHRQEGGEGYWYPYSTGIVYWNENKEEVLDTVKVGSDVVNPVWLEENGYLVWKGPEIDSLEADYAAYYCSITSMLQIACDAVNRMVVTTSAPAPGYEQDGKNFRHVWSISSGDGGETWTYATDQTGDVYHLFSECVYPSLAPDFGWTGHVVYQTDNTPGIAVRFEQHGVLDNEIVYLPFYTPVGIAENQTIALEFVSQNYPNPATDVTYVRATVKGKAPLKLCITNLVGKTVMEIDKGEVESGNHTFKIDTGDLPAGVYLYTVQSGNQQQTKKMIVQ